MVGTLKFGRDFLKLNLGWLLYALTGKSFGFAHRALVSLFCQTRGLANDWQSKALAIFNPAYKIQTASGILGELKREEIDKIAANIKRDGYAVFPKAVSKEICAAVIKLSNEIPAYIRASDEEIRKNPSAPDRQAIYQRGQPQGVRYTFRAADYLKSEIFQNFITDPTFLAVADAYLGSKPVLDVLDFWWHTDYSAQPDANAAQLYHFDMDRVAWVKFFIYFTDVDSDSGPHCFVRRSHRSNVMPAALLQKGYARLTDEEVLEYFSPDDLIEYLAEAGTVIAEDTRGLHKGKHVIKGDRLVINIQFSATLYGTTEYSHAKINKADVGGPEIKKRIQAFPQVFRTFFAKTSL